LSYSSGGEDEGLEGTPLVVANYDGGQVSLDLIAELDKSLTSQQHLRLVLGFYDPLGVGLFRLDTGSLSAAKLKGKKVFISTGILNLTPVECWVNYSLFIDGILTDHAKKAARFSLLPTGQESETTNHQFATTIIDHQVISYGQS